VEESGRGLNAVLSRHLLGGSQGEDQNRRYWGRGLKSGPPKNKGNFRGDDDSCCECHDFAIEL
jgi:hypothetical protein